MVCLFWGPNSRAGCGSPLARITQMCPKCSCMTGRPHQVEPNGAGCESMDAWYLSAHVVNLWAWCCMCLCPSTGILTCPGCHLVQVSTFWGHSSAVTGPNPVREKANPLVSPQWGWLQRQTSCQPWCQRVDFADRGIADQITDRKLGGGQDHGSKFVAPLVRPPGTRLPILGRYRRVSFLAWTAQPCEGIRGRSHQAVRLMVR